VSRPNPRLAGLALAAATNDVVDLGRRLSGLEARSVVIRDVDLPDSVGRRPRKCSLLEVGIVSEAVEVVKYLLEFHDVEVVRGTVKMALSTGNAEIVRLLWQRVGEVQQATRADLLQVAADFHRDVPLGWLFRDANVLEREVAAEFALERKLADGLLVMISNGLRPWSWRTREVASGWSAASGLVFREPTGGLTRESGWWVSTVGAVTELPPGCSHRSWDRRERTVEIVFPFTLEVLEYGQAGGSCEVLVHVALPPGVTSIGVDAFDRCASLGTFHVPGKVTVIDESAFRGCSRLRDLELPASLETIGDHAFNGCSSLQCLIFPKGLQHIESRAFRHCTDLREVTFPSGSRTEIGRAAFKGCPSLRVVKIPKSLTQVGGGAFSLCPSLEKKTEQMIAERFGRVALANMLDSDEDEDVDDF
jgi:hypothetical protein